MKPLPWIQLLAYPSRREDAVHDLELTGARRIAATGRNLAVVRTALARAIEARLPRDGAPDLFDCTCTNAPSAYGFRVRVTAGPSAGHTVWVDEADGAVACGFHSEMHGCGCAAHTATIDFERAAIVVARSGGNSSRRFTSADELATHLLDVLIAHR